MAVNAEAAKILRKMKKQSKGTEKKARTKAPKVRGRSLPGGIRDGIAKLISHKIDLDKNQNPYVLLSFVALIPESEKGTRASTMYGFSELEWRTLEECYDQFYGDLQLMGYDTSDLEIDEFDKVLTDLAESEIYVTFNTKKRKNSDDVDFYIQGLADEDDLAELDLDDTGEEEDEEEDEEAETEETEDDEEEEDNDEAEEDDDEAEEEEDDSDEDSDWTPEKGEVYGYKVNSRSKSAPYKVTSVNKSKQTVALKGEDNGKVYKDVSWDKLED